MDKTRGRNEKVPRLDFQLGYSKRKMQKQKMLEDYLEMGEYRNHPN
jgi:hypothetical protein